MNNLQTMSPQQMMANSTPVTCAHCDGRFFNETFMFRKVSKILAGGSKDVLIPIPAHRCYDCGAPISDMLPEEPAKPATPEEPAKSNIITMNTNSNG